MKWTVLVGLLGVGIGFLLGSSREGEGQSEGKPAVVKRSRGIEGGISLRETGKSRERRWKVAEDISKKLALGVSLDQVEKGRLAEWILGLEAEDFPGVLEVLRNLGNRANADPFESELKNGDFLTLGMARWYELEGESVLQWILTDPAVLRIENPRVLVGNLIRDGYSRDPDLSFQLLKKYADVVAKKEGRKGIGVSWRYQLGRWSKNLKNELAELKQLEEIHGLSLDETAYSGDGVPHPEISLLRGLIEGKRTEEARKFYEEDGPGGFERYERILAKMNEDEIARRGWRELKSAIERGEVEDSEVRAKEIFEGWVAEDPQAAISWFLGQRFEKMDRSDQIKEAAFSGAFVIEGDWRMRRKRTDYDEILKFLDQKEAEVEPVQESFSVMMSVFADESDWDGMEQLKSRVSLEVWRRGLSQINEAATDRTTFQFGGGEETLEFIEFEEGGRELVERFGIQDEVLEEIAGKNEESLRKLMKQLGVEGE